MRTAWTLALIVSASLALAPAAALAQGRGGFGGGFGGYGGGFGLGYGFGIYPYYYSPALPENLLYRQALRQGSRATMGPVTHDVYQDNPAGYIHHLRDPRYLGGMNAEERRRIEAQIARFTEGPPPRAQPSARRAAPATPNAPATPATPIAPTAPAAPPPAAPPSTSPAEVHPTPQAAPAAGALRHEPRRGVE